MKLSGRIVVEPLDEERLTNIERRVVSGAVDAAARPGLRAPRRISGRVLAVAAVVTAGLAGWALHVPPPAVVAEPAAIGVDTSARAVLDIGDARIASEPNSRFAVTRPAGGVLVAMTRGKLELEVGKRAGRPPLIVRAGDTEVVVVGTRFKVAYDQAPGTGDVEVRVTEGVVRVLHQQQETRVGAGNAWRTQGGLFAIASGEASGRSDVPLAAAGTRAGAPHAAGAASGETVPTRTAIAIPTGPAPTVLHDRRAAVPDARATTPAGRAPQVRATSPAAPRAAPLIDPRSELRDAIRREAIEPALDLGESDAASAVTRYYDIAAHQSGEAASQAFYSIAVVRHLRLGRSVEALQTLDAYVRRFPGGKEYRAALWLRVRILCLDKLDDRCRAAAYTFVHQAPDAPAARVAERITLSD